MAREITFRAWDKEQKRFGYYKIGSGRIAWPSPDYLDQELIQWNGRADGVAFPTVEEWQEWTGLTDKNGKQLYFGGDLVEIDGYEGRWTAVRDDFGIPCFLPSPSLFGVCLEFKEVFFRMTATRDCFEIVGNIHEVKSLAA